MSTTFRVSGVPDQVNSDMIKGKVEKAYNVKINLVRIEEGDATLSTSPPASVSEGKTIGSIRYELDEVREASCVNITFEELESLLLS